MTGILKPPSRKDVRNALASVIRGATSSYQAIYTFQNDDLAGQSPVLRILSSASERPRATFKGSFATFGFTFQSLVVYKDTENTTEWTPQEAEDLLDDLEQQLAEIFLETEWPSHGKIKSVAYAGPTYIRKDVIQGKTYLTEYIPILVEAFYG